MYVGARVTKRVVFAAAHHLDGLGKCENLHGHNWQADIEVTMMDGELKNGIVVDVAALKQAAFKYDHDNLDKYFEFPSTENVAHAIAEDALRICTDYNPDATFSVTVHLIETENNSAYSSATNFSYEMPPLITEEQAIAAEQQAAFLKPSGLPVAEADAKFVKRQVD